tara:strand:- start:1166 stop:1972 length:807 start_codon:yes stop_codon:yes gene_type:complete
MLYLKIFVCLLVIVCFIFYYSKKKEPFQSNINTIQSYSRILVGDYEYDLQSLDNFQGEVNIGHVDNLFIDIEIEFNDDDDDVIARILQFTHSIIGNDDNLGFNNQVIKVKNPIIFVDKQELIQITKIPPIIQCNNNEFIMRLPLNPTNYSTILVFMESIQNIFREVNVKNIKFYNEVNDISSNGYIYVIIKNTDIESLLSLYDTYNSNYRNYSPTRVCPQLTTTTQGAGGAIIGGSGGGGIPPGIVVTPESTTQQPFVLDQNQGEVVF